MNRIPLVSIVIPAYNPRFFSAAIHSALSQSWTSLEIIVSDDSGDDDIRRIVDSLDVPDTVSLSYLHNPVRLGFVGNLHSAMAQVRGEFVKVLCDDDRLFAQCIEQQARVLIEHEDVNLVLCQRFLVDAEDFVLPPRMSNNLLNSVDTLFKGGDMLDLVGSLPVNVLGHFSSSMMRTVDVQGLLPVLTQEGSRFTALLDFALFVCLLRRGNMVMLRSVLSAERLHPGRLGKQPFMLEAAATEYKWLAQMLAARGGEGAPAMGWMRGVELSKVIAGQPHAWEEIALLRAFSNLQTFLQARVGSESESYDEFYADWLNSRRFSPQQLRLMPETVAAWPTQPRLAVVVVDPEGDAAGLALVLESIERQIHAAQRIVVLSAQACVAHANPEYLPLQADWVAQCSKVIEGLAGIDWIYLLRPGDQLVDSALLVLAERIANLPDVRCIYSDESSLVEGVSKEPVFKPDFNLDLMRSYPYVGRALAFSRSALLECKGLDSSHGELAPHDLLWKLVERHGPQVVGHIAHIQLASAFSFAQWLSAPDMIVANRHLLEAHLQRIGVEHRLMAGEMPLINRVHYLSSAEPLVSIVIRAGQRLSVLQRCIETLLEKTAYTHYEVLIVQDADAAPEVIEWLAAMAQLGSHLFRVLKLSGHDDEVANLLNQAATQAHGEYLLFLSGDAVLIGATWLDELLNHARRPEVGGVGGTSLSPRGVIVPSGLIVGLGGLAASPFAGENAAARGYMQRLQATQNWSAISADCLMVRKELFESLGGFDVADFPSALHDVDLCLRIVQAGYLLVTTPYSSIVLDKDSSLRDGAAPATLSESAREVFYRRWIRQVAADPAYNPNLSLAGGNFALNPGLKNGWNPFCARTLPSVLVLPINNSAVGQYRTIQPLAELMAAGRVVGQSRFDAPSMVDIERMSPDVMIFQCQYSNHSPAYIASVKKYSQALRIFELDDYVVHAPKKNLHARNKAQDIEQILRQSIASCDRVVVSTQALKDVLADMHDDIRVVPNMLPPQMWSGLVSRRRTSSRPRVGWGGGTSHTGDLEIIADVVRELANEVEWVFFGMCPNELKPYVHEFHPVVDLKLYPARLASLNLDLALAPLEFHIFNDCKSNLRLLEYGICGYPVVCTDTEAYRGFLPCTRVKSNSTEEWLQAIRMHLADPEASYRMGDQLREAVLQNFMLSGDNLRHWEWGWLPDPV